MSARHDHGPHEDCDGEPMLPPRESCACDCHGSRRDPVVAMMRGERDSLIQALGVALPGVDRTYHAGVVEILRPVIEHIIEGRISLHRVR